MGISLHRIKDIRQLYGEDSFGISPIDFDEPRVKPQAHGHAIAARITSENPNEVTSGMRGRSDGRSFPILLGFQTEFWHRGRTELSQSTECLGLFQYLIVGWFARVC